MAAEKVAEQVVEQVAEHLEDAAEVTRSIDMTAVRYFLGGVGLGVAIGFYFGYRFNREKIKAAAFKESEAEIENIREHYRQKTTAVENAKAKGIIVEEQYRPQDKIEVHVEEEVHYKRPLPPPVPISSRPRVYRTTAAEKDKMDDWHFPTELARRSSDAPYIIHQDEFAHNETEYPQVSYTYYAEDDVLLDEEENILSDRDALIGAGVLNRFGHGTDDFNILYIRNPVLELEIEICRDTGSYEEQVLGLEREPENGGTD